MFPIPAMSIVAAIVSDPKHRFWVSIHILCSKIEIILKELISGEHLSIKLNDGQQTIYKKHVAVLQGMDKDDKYHQHFIRPVRKSISASIM